MKEFNTHRYEFKLFREMTPTLRYDGIEPFEEWQKRARAKLTELLGLPLTHGTRGLEIEYTIECDEYVEYRFTVETEPDYFIPCHLRIHKGIEGKIPLTVCASGHGGGMHVALGVAKCEKDEVALEEWPHRNMAARSVKEGRAALVFENRSFGECSLEGYGTSCQEAAKIALLMGRTVLGERVWDAMCILDEVEKNFPDIDMKNIVCTGNSGGGTVTYYLACIDERITAAAPSCSVCNFDESIAAKRHCMCNYVPSIRKYFEMGDLGGLIAPRKLVIAAGTEDPGFFIKGTYDAYREIERAYAAAGVPENCALEVADGGHLNYADHLWSRLHKMGI